MTVPRNLDAWHPSTAMRKIRDDVARAFFITPEEMLGRSRLRHVVQARNAACWVLREMFSLSYPCLGKVMGDRDHSTVIYACRNAAARREVDPAFRDRTDHLLAGLPAVDLAPIDPSLVDRLVPVPPPVEVKPGKEAQVQDARKVRERNRFHGDFSALDRFNGTRKLAAAIAASGGGFR